MITRQAAILVGGKGTRLGALTADTPKPLMPMEGGRVFLDEVIFDVARHGFNDILLLAGHLHEQFTSRYHGQTICGARIRVVVEPEPAGTGGALAIAAPLLAPTFLFVNGDTSFDINLRRLDPLLAASPEAAALLALRRVPDAARFGSVATLDGRITGFFEKQADAPSVGGCINGGIGLFRRDILSLVNHSPCSIETEVYPRLARAGRLLGTEFSGYFIDIGIPETLAQARQDMQRRRRPAVFFDRDGVLNHDAGYTHRIEDLRWTQGAIETVRRVNDLGAFAIVVTNQAGVGYGFYPRAAVEDFHRTMEEQLAQAGAHIDAFYVSPHHSEAKLDEYRHPDHPDRKPNPGMILAAMRDWPIDATASFLIGDKPSDIEAAKRAGIPGVFFESGDLYDVAAPHLDRLPKRSEASASLSN